MGKRKLRLKAVKNYERKKYHGKASWKVSIPIEYYTNCHSTVPDDNTESELKISIPLQFYTSSTVPDASKLRARLDMCNLLPKEWVMSSHQVSELDTPFLALYRKVPTLATCTLQSVPNSVDLISMKIAPDCTWFLSIGTYQLDLTHCQLLEKFLFKKVNSVDLLILLLSQLDCITLCIGNPDEKFTGIRERHKGEFKDQTGTVML